jgi:DNA modification methylase
MFFVKNIITWTFNNMQNCTNRLSGRYENIIWAIKDKTKFKFNLDEVRVEYITKNDKRLTGLGRNPTDVWFFNRVNNVTKKKKGISHPTVYPEEMIERIIKMTTNINDIVLDPFLGSGTTIVAALELNRKAIGIELDKKYEKEIIKRINEIKQKLL